MTNAGDEFADRHAPLSGNLPLASLSALGVVFGDIGTGPLYTPKSVLALTGEAPPASATRADQVASLVQVSGIPFRRLRKCNTQTFSAGGNLVQPSTCLERVLSVFADFCRLSSLGGQMKKLLVALVATLVAVSMAGCVGFGKGKAPPPRVVTKG